jgi:hypothetical protein
MYDATRLSVCISICVSAAADSGAGGIADPAAVTVETLALAAHAAIGKTEDVPRPAVHARRMRVEPTEARWGHCSLCAMLTMLDAGVIIALYRFISRLIMMMRARARATQKNTSLWDCTTNLYLAGTRYVVYRQSSRCAVHNYSPTNDDVSFLFLGDTVSSNTGCFRTRRRSLTLGTGCNQRNCDRSNS